MLYELSVDILLQDFHHLHSSAPPGYCLSGVGHVL